MQQRKTEQRKTEQNKSNNTKMKTVIIKFKYTEMTKNFKSYTRKSEVFRIYISGGIEEVNNSLSLFWVLTRKS